MTGDYDLKSLVQAHRLCRCSLFDADADAHLAGARLYLAERILAQVLATRDRRLALCDVISEAYYRGQIDEMRRREA